MSVKAQLAQPEGFVLRSADEDALRRSASGAAFWDMGVDALERGALVCGCRWDDNLRAVHVVVDDIRELPSLQGSKYVRSDFALVVQPVLKALATNIPVLFSGTPCQCRAMVGLAEREMGPAASLLTTVALVCHGTARPFLWEAYKSDLEKEQEARLVGVCFRDKSLGYGSSQCRYTFETVGGVNVTRRWPTYLEDKFIFASIVYNLGLDANCYRCSSKGFDQPFDLIIGDWYAEDTGPGRWGTSCVVALTTTGKDLIQKCFPDAVPTKIEDIIEKNRPLVEHVAEPENNKEFIEEVRRTGSLRRAERYFPKRYLLKRLLIKIGVFGKIKHAMEG